MKTLTTRSLVLIILPLVLACTDQKKEAQDRLFDEVMAIHDSIMPAMRDITNLQKEVKARLDELDSTAQIEENRLQMERQRLDSAHNAMMEWMRAFEKDFEGKTHEEVMEYLENQKERIQGVEQMMEESISQTQEFLKED
jgi:regulator of replication initiation timing